MRSSNETRSKKAIKMINNGATWDEVAQVLGVCKEYARQIVKSHYKTRKAYDKLLSKAKANRRAMRKKEEKSTEDVFRNENDDSNNNDKNNNEVVVVETGYLLKEGFRDVISEDYATCLPLFCLSELQKLSYSLKNAESLIETIYDERNVVPISLRGKEMCFNEPNEHVKNRSYGVVALCCYLSLKGYTVSKLYTSSREIEKLAKAQNIPNLSVIRVKASNLN